MRPISDLPDLAFIDELKKLNGTPEKVFDTPGLIEFCLPYIRADFLVVERFKTAFFGQLPVSSTVVYGTCDKMSQHDMQEWQSFFTQNIRLMACDGDHFFIHNEKNIKRVIKELLIAASPAAVKLNRDV